MATATRTNSFTTGETIVAAEVNEDLDDLFALVNNDLIHADGTNAFTTVPAGPATDPTTDNQFTRKAYVDKKAGGVVAYKTVDTGASYSNVAAGAAVNTYYGAGGGNLTISVSEVTDHWYRATFNVPAIKTSRNGVVVFGISVPNRIGIGLQRDGTEVARTWGEHMSQDDGIGLMCQAVWKATATASKDVTAHVRHDNSTSTAATISYASDGEFPIFTLVEDLGLSI